MDLVPHEFLGLRLLVVLAGVIWWSNKKQAATPADTTVKILSIPEDQFQQLRIKKLTNEVIELRRDGAKRGREEVVFNEKMSAWEKATASARKEMEERLAQLGCGAYSAASRRASLRYASESRSSELARKAAPRAASPRRA